MITSISYDQDQILKDIITLHIPSGKIDVDAAYGNGGFYKSGRILRPDFCLEPFLKDNSPAFLIPKRAEELHEIWKRPNTKEIKSIIFDPPFIHAHGKNSIMGERFGSYPSQEKLFEMYQASFHSFGKALIRKDVVVWKTQDIVESGKQVWNHIKLYEEAPKHNFYLKDLFLLLAKQRPKGHNHTKQKHARKFHSYFMVFVKK